MKVMNYDIKPTIMPDDILQKNYDKYKDKTGRKARNLKLRIEGMKAFNKLSKEALKINP